ncbi:glycosyltransferase family 4 protein [Brevundimonas sp. NPDC092305]|uniref:glycosyltransferase family 4 protein n=1 Tax=Brevundimonas sp. NPDC092305 TaxID=3363957 RepID=UPI003813F75B
MKILVCGGNPAMLPHFRGPVLTELAAQGHEIVAVGGWANDAAEAQLNEMGVRYRTWPIVPTGLNPLADAVAVRHLIKICREERPDVFFGYALKPGMYGAIAARVAHVPRRVVLIEGLGYAFGRGRELKRLVARAFAELVFKIGLRATHHLVVLNRDDELFFRRRARSLPITRMPGIGVDLSNFRPAKWPAGPMTFVMISRLLRDKGVGIFVETARRVRKRHDGVRFLLVGPWDPSPNGFTENEVSQWRRQGWVDYVGAQSDVRPFLAQAHALVLPSSYREGLPATLMEAAASGRAVITTDGPGCRDGVLPGQTGLLLQRPTVENLEEAIETLIDNPQAAEKMALNARSFAEDNFDVADHARNLAHLLTATGDAPAQSVG